MHAMSKDKDLVANDNQQTPKLMEQSKRQSRVQSVGLSLMEIEEDCGENHGRRDYYSITSSNSTAPPYHERGLAGRLCPIRAVSAGPLVAGAAKCNLVACHRRVFARYLRNVKLLHKLGALEEVIRCSIGLRTSSLVACSTRSCRWRSTMAECFAVCLFCGAISYELFSDERTATRQRRLHVDECVRPAYLRMEARG